MSDKMTYIEILELLEKTSSTNDKIEILKKNSDNKELRKYLELTLSKHITFGIAELPEYELETRTGTDEFDLFQGLCEGLHRRVYTGKAAKEAITNLLKYTSPEYNKWYRKCLQKDLSSIGLGQSVVDKAFGTTTKFKLGLAEEQEELDKIDDEQDGYLDKKCNGFRTTVPVEDGKIKVIYSGRNGIEAENFYFIEEELEALVKYLGKEFLSAIYDGEMHVDDDAHKTTSLYGFKWQVEEDFLGKNGKVKVKAYEKYKSREAEILEYQRRAKFTIFDFIPKENWDKQVYDKVLSERKKDLVTIEKAIKALGLKQIEVVPTEYVKNKHLAIKAAQKWIDKGFEGGIFKVSNGCYQWKRWRTWVKCKREVTFEIQLTNYVVQKDKYNPDGTLKPKMIGKVIGLDRFGNLQEVGTGEVLDEKTRIDMFNNWDAKYKGKIYQCSAQESSKVSGKYINPRLDMERLDRIDLD